MKNVATIIAGKNFNLNEIESNHIVDALQHSGAIIENVVWLSQEKACDIYFAVLNADEAKQVLTALLENVDADFAVQGEYNRKKKLLVSDMDSTIIQQECIDEIADFLDMKDKVVPITESAMNGEIDFIEALIQRVKLLKGLPENKLINVYEERIKFTEGAKSLVSTMKLNGAKTILVSGGFTFFTNLVKRDIGFDVDESNILEIIQGELTGEVKRPIVDSVAKLNSLNYHCEQLGISAEMSLAVGDGANDLKMIEASGMGVAFCAKKLVKDRAKVALDIPDLRSLLYIQGYKDSEIIEN